MNDTIYRDTIAYLKTIKHPFYYFITSDHSELTGQDGIYGHTVNSLKTLEIPQFLYTNDKNRKILNKFKNNPTPTNYEIALLLTETMGYKIDNPNTPENIYYVIDDWDKKGLYYKITKETPAKDGQSVIRLEKGSGM